MAGSLQALARAGAELSCLIPHRQKFSLRLAPGLRLRSAQCARREGPATLWRAWRLGLPYKFAKYHCRGLLAAAREYISRERPTLILIHGSHLGQMGLQLGAEAGLPVVLRPHNLEYRLVEQYAQQLHPLLRPLALRQAARTRKLERQLWCRAERVLFISDNDLSEAQTELAAADMRPKGILSCAYDGVDFPAQSQQRPLPHSFLLSGSVEVAQNRRSLTWFLRQIWFPFARRQQKAGVQLAICGVDPGRFISALPTSHQALQAHGVRLLGFVPKFQEEVSRHRFFVSPTIMGSGYRLKLAEAGAAGTSLLLTELDANSLQFLQNGVNCRVFDDAASFEQAWENYRSDPENEAACRQALLQALRQRMDWSEHAQRLLGEAA